MFRRCCSAVGGKVFLGWFPKEEALGSRSQSVCLSVLADLGTSWLTLAEVCTVLGASVG